MVAPTFSNPDHFSIILAEATFEAFARLRSAFSEPVGIPAIAPLTRGIVGSHGWATAICGAVG